VSASTLFSHVQYVPLKDIQTFLFLPIRAANISQYRQKCLRQNAPIQQRKCVKVSHTSPLSHPIVTFHCLSLFLVWTKYRRNVLFLPMPSLSEPVAECHLGGGVFFLGLQISRFLLLYSNRLSLMSIAQRRLCIRRHQRQSVVVVVFRRMGVERQGQEKMHFWTGDFLFFPFISSDLRTKSLGQEIQNDANDAKDVFRPCSFSDVQIADSLSLWI